ncbi:MAG TPA: efflux transporter periplasmic adaptor subunit [Muricauda sp.]|uniref:Efflux RND transporter periplasmic adaptor subunit n=1 Tax=Flagellimonas chongwuensis TaxID=2697365 RepID=A0A850NB64_9FLAO|nr:efflux RND transporter periplasmic adaptor subunit [Allomuricauda chongwuensis]MAO15960.1 efflux transporter periplasmic adaptor subunit [Allomuricauda sp.]UBZ15695.1 efflux RND transporter periplasmic adaptor subunit [Allomuricauda aquimarina]MBC71079.1 efflux transporter periplasmic adaptor subunit [Allomuricauda sp.]NVN17134.1 efflux RND transporter periplasmic adaptor subunit [Allomuricauda chongwuensis]HBU78947.1 efflux transporter periplasmic adaptor subunit [Allomuricauda sp.]|tara:strand:- start:2110 stop:3360 length:1251 start_codon:yes stop_codon:yes gene_type:complete
MDIQLEKKKGLKLKHYGYIALGILLLFVGYKLIFASSMSTFRTEKDRLSISSVTAGKFDDYITINGNVAPIATIYMDAYEGGRVSEKLIEEGSMVKQGDIILKLENMALYEQILASESNLALKQNDLRSTKLTFDSRQVEGRKSLATAQYDVQRLKRAYEQNKELYEEELVSKETYLKSKEDYELAQKQYEIVKLQTEQDDELRETSLRGLDTDLDRMQKTLSMVYERLDHLNVRAPADGQLGFLDAEIGQNISQGQRIGQINVLTDFKIEADIDEHYIDRVKRDLSASLERNGNEYKLRLRKVYPEVRNGRFRVDLVFVDEKPETIRAGQSYNIRLQLGESNDAMLLPKGGFFQSTGGQWVFVVSPDGNEAIKRNVRLGKQNSRYYEVLEGLQPGEQVITSNYDSFGDAERIVLK